MNIFPIILLVFLSHPADAQESRKPSFEPHPNQTRLLFAPTGRSLRQGSGYVGDHMLFFPSVAFGVSDQLTLSGGFSIVPEVAPNEQLFYFAPKLGVISSDDLNVSIGALVGGFPGTDEVDGTGGILYGVGTLGPPESSMTVGLGFGFAEGNVSGKPVILLGGEHRISEGAALISENWILPGESPLLSMGVRLFGKRFSVDVAAMGIPGKDPVWFPWFDLVYSFGH